MLLLHKPPRIEFLHPLQFRVKSNVDRVNYTRTRSNNMGSGTHLILYAYATLALP